MNRTLELKAEGCSPARCEIFGRDFGSGRLVVDECHYDHQQRFDRDQFGKTALTIKMYDEFKCDRRRYRSPQIARSVKNLIGSASNSM